MSIKEYIEKVTKENVEDIFTTDTISSLEL
jgi:hypothetical protein